MKYILIGLVFFAFNCYASERGQCKAVGSNSKEMAENEIKCEKLNTNHAGCSKDKGCYWLPDKKSCIAIDRDNDNDSKTCIMKWNDKDCADTSGCKWDYIPYSCHPKDTSSPMAASCENYDTNESLCKANRLCFWGAK